MAKNEVSNKPQKMSIMSYMTNPAVKGQITNVMGDSKANTFISSVVSAVQTNPALAKCTNASIVNAALLGESLQLPPSPQLGFYYMVPYGNEAQFQLGAAGYKQLAVRSGLYRKIVSTPIKDGEFITFNPITEEILFNPILDPDEREKAPTIGYYAMFETTEGFKKEIYWSKEKMEAHAAKYSQTYKSDKKYNSSRSVWSNNFDAMAEKTMIRTLIRKWGIMSIDMQKAVVSDMGVINDDGSVTYVDNQGDAAEEAREAIDAGANTEEFVDAEFSEVPSEDEINEDNPFADS